MSSNSLKTLKQVRQRMEQERMELAAIGAALPPELPTIEQQLASAVLLRARSLDMEENSQERVLIRRELRYETAQFKAAELSAPAESEWPVFDPETYYLIHVPKSSTHLEDGEQEIDLLDQRLMRAAGNKRRTNLMAYYLWETEPFTAQKLASCNTFRWFRHWLETGDCRLIAAKCCKQDKLCPVCANLRAVRNASRYHKRILKALAENPNLTEYMWTFTVKDGANLVERLAHLKNFLRILIDHRRKVRNGSSRNVWMPFCSVAGGVYSIEITIGKNSGQWHPHVHIYTLCDGPVPLAGTRCYEMETWWHQRTGDSFVVDCRPITSRERGGAVLEVLKYSLKFSSMSLEQTYEAWKVTSKNGRMQLMRGFGLLHGVPEVKNLLEEMSRDEGEFVDIGYRYKLGQYVRDDTGPRSGQVMQIFNDDMQDTGHEPVGLETELTEVFDLTDKRQAVCELCGHMTPADDWQIYDGKTGVCQCRSCLCGDKMDLSTHAQGTPHKED